LPIDGVIADLGRLDRSMGDAADASAVKQSDAAAASADRMQEAATSLPQPMRGWILGVTKTSADMSLGGARDKLLAAWRGGAGPECESTVVDRYPFRVDAPRDVPLRDFAQLFGHDGTLDRFFKDNLDTLVDASHHPWRWRKSGAEDTGLGTEPLHAFEVAAAIRDSYFVGATPSLGFTLTPTALGDAAASVTLTSDGQTVSYDQGGAATPVRLQWPGPAGSSGATISFKPRGAGAPEAISATGPWAWFHVLDHAQIRRLDGSNHFSLSFSIGSYSASFDMEAEGPTPPIPNSPTLEFHCPWPQ
jgi:type VI secretion system protein ImpL